MARIGRVFGAGVRDWESDEGTSFPSTFNHCPEGCPVEAEGFVNRQPWLLDGGGKAVRRGGEAIG